MKLIRSLVLPWILFFIVLLTASLLTSMQFSHLQPLFEKYRREILWLGSSLCFFANVHTMSRVGIWMTESLPESLRYTTIHWLLRALKAAAMLGIAVGIAKIPWVPLLWPGLVLPTLAAVGLFVIIFNLLGPLLKWTSQLTFNRTLGVLISLPLFVLVPFTALWITDQVTTSYQISRANLVLPPPAQASGSEPLQIKGRVLSVSSYEMRILSETPQGSRKTWEIKLDLLSPALLSALPKTPSNQEVSLSLPAEAISEMIAQTPPANSEDLKKRLHSSQPEVKTLALREIYEFSNSCSEYSKEIQGALDSKAPKKMAYWATQALKCSNIKAAAAMPKLVQLMYEHPDSEVRSAAIRAMKKYGDENIKRVTYLLLKRLNPQEPPEVVVAAATLMAPLGDRSTTASVTRLKSLLEVDGLSGISAQLLTQEFKRDDLVSEVVQRDLISSTPEIRDRAVGMICALPKSQRAFVEDHMEQVLAAIRSITPNDPGVKALHCLGRIGYAAISEELAKPRKLKRLEAARLLAQIDVKGAAEATKIAAKCSTDSDQEVRKWCSQTLGRLGSKALPEILKLLDSSDSHFKESGRNALNHFNDVKAIPELKKVLSENSGWMANQKRLQTAKVIGSALARLENEPGTL